MKQRGELTECIYQAPTACKGTEPGAVSMTSLGQADAAPCLIQGGNSFKILCRCCRGLLTTRTEGWGDTMQEVRSDAGGTLAGEGTAGGTAGGIRLGALWEVARDEAGGQGRAGPGLVGP